MTDASAGHKWKRSQRIPIPCPSCRTGEILESTQECDTCHTPIGLQVGGPIGEHDTAHDAKRYKTLDLPAVDEIEAGVKRHLDGDYQLEGHLGRGGMSVVFLAREKELNRLVALKVLPMQLVLGTAAVDRFRREAKIAASLDHRHIVPIYRVGTTSSFLWYTMKYVPGRSLAHILEETGRLELDACFDIVGQVASALVYAHRRGVVHRDIKPENLIIDGDGWVWVCDYGVAKAFGAIPLTHTGTTLGTPSYMSPEQCYGQSVDGRSDQYSLASLVYRCLVGHTPYMSDSLGAMIRMQCMEPAPRLADDRPDLPPRVSTAVARAMNKKPDDRFEDVAKFVEAMGGRVSVQVVNRSLQELSISGVHAVTPPAPDAPAIRRAPVRRRWRRRVSRLALALVAPAAILGAALWQFGETPPGPALASVLDATADTPDDSAAVQAEPLQAEPPASVEGSGETGAQAAPTEQLRQAAVRPAPPPRPGYISVQSQPWGYIYLDGEALKDGEELQFTPIIGRSIPSGRHTIRIVREGFEPYEHVIDVAPGETTQLTGIVLRETRQ